MVGGENFEPHEENPMIGLRGASRYLHQDFAAAFELECQALSYVRNQMGLTNVQLMVPFCRTIDEGKAVVELLGNNGLQQGKDGLKIWVMCEIPSNVLSIDGFAEVFDGFSIGTNDLTQLVLGCDRDSGDLAEIFDEGNPAVKMAITMAIQGAHRHGKKVGVCGQAPSDKPEFAAFLVEQGIDSISLTPDSVMQAMKIVSKAESELEEQHKQASKSKAEGEQIVDHEDIMGLYKDISEVVKQEKDRELEKSEDAMVSDYGLQNN